LLVPAGLAMWEGVELLRHRLAPDWRLRGAALACGPIVFGLWTVYVRYRIGEWPFVQGSDRLTAPLAGWVVAIQMASEMGTTTFHRMALGQAGLPMLIVVATLLGLGAIRAVRLRTPLDAIYLLMTTIFFCLAWPNL